MADKVQNRAALKDVTAAFTPVAKELGIDFQSEAVDFNKVGTAYIAQAQGGLFNPVVITDGGGTRPALPGLGQLKAADIVMVLNGVTALIPALRAADAAKAAKQS